MTSLTSQLRKKKTLKKSINFTLLIVGPSGSGRSTFINSLCDQSIVETSSTIGRPQDAHFPVRDLHLRPSQVELEDNEGVRIALSVIDTPGFGDSVENEFNFNLIVDYLRHQYDETLIEESKLRRNPRFKDGRVHCCLYFIEPTGHGMREMDVEMISVLGTLVNVIPVISKSDSLTKDEVKLNKRLISEDIRHFELPIYNFADDYFDIDDSETLAMNRYLQHMMPFAVMGSTEVIVDPVTQEPRRVRRYPWGVVDIESNDISDFQVLRNSLLISHLNDFREYTHEVLYENYRTQALGEGSYEPSGYGQAETGGGENSHMASPIPNDRRLPTDTTYGQDTYLAREEQIRLEEERLKAFEERVQRDLILKKKELEAREKELAEIEKRFAMENLSDQ